MSLQLALYVFFVSFGMVVSYEDWKAQKIRNRWILWGVGACGAALLYLFVNSLFGHWKMRWWGLGEYYLPLGFYPRVALHLLLAGSAGVALWFGRLWPAGDAKLYILFSLLAVLVDHNLVGFPFILFLRMLINIFVPAGLWVLASAAAAGLWRMGRSGRESLLKGLTALVDRAVQRAMEVWPYRYGYALHLLNMYILFIALHLLCDRIAMLRFMQDGLGQLLMMLGLYVVFAPLNNVLQKYRYGPVVLAAAWWFIWGEDMRIRWGFVLWGSARNLVFFGLLLGVMQSLIRLFLRKESEEQVGYKELRSGMILSEEAWRAVKKLWSGETPAPNRYADGLFPDDLAALHSWKDVPDLVLAVYRATPFAVWVFLGSLITLTSRRNVMYWMMRFWSDASGTVAELLRSWCA
ncbi:MAG: hypothetical protein WC728_11875 [Elusimicrobiota bacterium]